MPENNADSLAMVQARVEKKDPEAIYFLAYQYCHGKLGLQKDMEKAVELFTEAADLGSIEALFNLGYAYDIGRGVNRTRQRAFSSTKKRPCKAMLKAGTILAVVRGLRETATAQ